jgi:hypothetical protein
MHRGRPPKPGATVSTLQIKVPIALNERFEKADALIRAKGGKPESKASIVLQAIEQYCEAAEAGHAPEERRERIAAATPHAERTIAESLPEPPIDKAVRASLADPLSERLAALEERLVKLEQRTNPSTDEEEAAARRRATEEFFTKRAGATDDLDDIFSQDGVPEEEEELGIEEDPTPIDNCIAQIVTYAGSVTARAAITCPWTKRKADRLALSVPGHTTHYYLRKADGTPLDDEVADTIVNGQVEVKGLLITPDTIRVDTLTLMGD